MNRIILNDLPIPPPGKSGWPWVQQIAQDSLEMADVSHWPRVSIVTPSYNQGRFLEETIRSVLLQGYPNLEYFIMDGGSTDESCEIIKKYSPWLAGWVSEKDHGQSHAINKGLKRSIGKFWAWLNSDDIYLPGAIFRAVRVLIDNPETALVYGDGLWLDSKVRPIPVYRSCLLDARSLLIGSEKYGIPQAAAFMRRDAVESIDGLNEGLQMALDYDLWVRLSFRYPIKYMPGRPFAGVHSHADMKTKANELGAYMESVRVLTENLKSPLCPRDITIFNNLQYIEGTLGVARC